MSILVDSSVLLDILTDDPVWASWSEEKLSSLGREQQLVINDIVWSECSVAFKRIEVYGQIIARMGFLHRQIPKEALFLAAKIFVTYRKAGGIKTAPLPDFFIGAHAAVEGMTLLTRGPKRMRTHFPRLKLICPDAPRASE